MNAIEMACWGDEPTDRTTLADPSELGTATTQPPPADPQPTDHLAKLLHVASQRAGEAATALDTLDNLVGGWERATTELRLIVSDRATCAQPLRRLHAALEPCEAEAQRLGLAVEFDGCLPQGDTSGLSRVLLDANRTEFGILEHDLHVRMDKYRDVASALRGWAEEMGE